MNKNSSIYLAIALSTFIRIVFRIFGIKGVIILVLIILIFLIIWLLNRCEYCKKSFSLKKIRTDIIKEEDISIKTKIENRDPKGELLFTSEQYIPGKKITYRTEYICKNCGHKSFNTYSEKKKSI